MLFLWNRSDWLVCLIRPFWKIWSQMTDPLTTSFGPHCANRQLPCRAFATLGRLSCSLGQSSLLWLPLACSPVNYFNTLIASTPSNCSNKIKWQPKLNFISGAKSTFACILPLISVNFGHIHPLWILREQFCYHVVILADRRTVRWRLASEVGSTGYLWRLLEGDSSWSQERIPASTYISDQHRRPQFR